MENHVYELFPLEDGVFYALVLQSFFVFPLKRWISFFVTIKFFLQLSAISNAFKNLFFSVSKYKQISIFWKMNISNQKNATELFEQFRSDDKPYLAKHDYS